MTTELDWDIIVKRRSRIIEHNDEIPAYLVLPEVKQLLNSTPKAKFHFFLNTL